MGITARRASRDSARHAGYLWGLGRLWGEPVAINTGDTGCGTARLCSRNGLFPRLASTALGRPLDAAPRLVVVHGHVRLMRRFEDGTLVVDPNARAASVQRGQALRSLS
jgi:hypothetical protein